MHRHRHAHQIAAIGLLAVVLAAAPDRAVAAVKVRALELSATPGGPSATRFDTGTRTIHARFAYEEAADDLVVVSVAARGGLSVFSEAQRYSGAGQATVVIDGTAIVRSLAGKMAEAAASARTSAALAASQESGVHERLQMVRAGLVTVESVRYLLERTDLGATSNDQMQAIGAVVHEATDIVVRAIALSDADQARKRELARDLDGPLGELEVRVGQVEQSVLRLEDLAIPTTGSAPGSAYTVQLRVDSHPVEAVEFGVYDLPVAYLPWCGSSAKLGQ